MSSPYSLTIQYERTEGKRAVFSLPDGQQLFWPLKSVPEHYTSGQTYTIGFEPASKITEKPEAPEEQPIKPTGADKQLAIALLEELFKKDL